MKNFNVRKWWHFGKDYRRSISIEIAGWKSNPRLYINVDGDEGDVTFNFSLGIAIYITFGGILPRSWYPHEWSDYSNQMLPARRKISFAIHDGSFWYCLWRDDNSWHSGDKRQGAIHVRDWLRGKHKYEKKELEKRQYVLPFFEGNYNIEVTKNERTDSWPRWFTRKMITFEAKFGYYNEKKEWIDRPVPVEGKGENSYDCDEDATYCMSFPGLPFNKTMRSNSLYEAALYAWHSMMRDRERRGSPTWTPAAFRGKKLEILK